MKITQCLCGLLVYLATCGCATVAHADPLLDQGLRKMAEEIKSFLQEERLPLEIIVGDFTATPRLKTSGGVEISRAITTQLAAVGTRVSDDANQQLMGKFTLTEKKQHSQDDFESVAMEIQAIILDGEDKELAELPITVFGSVALHIGGRTVDVPPMLPEKERQEMQIRQIKQPPTKVQEQKTKPSTGSPFGMEILVKNGNRLISRSPKLDSQNRAFVDLRRGEEYVVRLHNDAPFQVAVCLTVDGVDVFVDAQDAPRDSRFVVYPSTHIDVPGWYFTKTHSIAFEIGGYEESVAQRVGNSTGVGTITAAFQACWDPNGPRPADEPAGAPKGGKATKQGRDVNKNYIQLIRDFGHFRAIISVRYDR